MKKKILYIVVLLVVLIAGGLIYDYVIKQRSNSGRVKIVSSPSAGVFIDNVAVGKTPFEQKMDAGTYVVKLIPEGVAEDTVSWQGEVTVHKNSLTYINRELGSADLTSAGEIFTVLRMQTKPSDKNVGEIKVETEPPGAIVYLNNDEKGVSPMVLQDVPKGDHEISVFLPGFFRRTSKVNVDGGYSTITDFKLALDQTQKSIEEIQREKAKAEQQKAREASESAQVAGESTASAQTAEIDGDAVTILDTPTGWLRVRSAASVDSEEVTRINPDEVYELLEEDGDWYKIKIDDDTEGWIASEYAEKKEN